MSLEAIVGRKLGTADRAALAISLATLDTISTQLAQVRALLSNIKGASKNAAGDLPAGFEAAIDAALAALPAQIE